MEIEQIYRSLSSPLTRLAYLLIGDREEAQDVVQSVFATAAQRWTTIVDPHAYLRQAVVNRANDSHRKAFRRTAATRPAALATSNEPVLDGVWEFVQSLPRTQRTVVVLRYYADLSLVDIAEVLGRPASTVRSDLRRALMNLKENLT
jgi:RNA polymerase sigma factor (sigma-70 family)